jgi:hypothetical protein
MEWFRLITFKKLVKKRIGPSNLFVCVGPYFGDKDRSKHMDSFAKYFKGEEIFSEDLDAYELDANNSWTCMVRCFGVGDLEYSISDKTLSTEVTDEDIENGIEDEYGVVYSKDGKRLLKDLGCWCKTYTIKKRVKVICDNAFLMRPSLQSIVIPNSVTSIGDWAFEYCTFLKSIVIPESVTSIGNGAFHCCKSLQSIVIPESVTSIGTNPFADSGVRSIVSHSKYFTVDRKALYDQKEKLLIACFSKGYHFVVPDNVTSIGDWAFCGCESLQSIVIPNSVTSIGDWAFCGCESLQSIVIPESVTSIGNYAFYDCISLQSIVIPNSVTSIWNHAFNGCRSLQSIVIPNSVTCIGYWAFSDCKSLRAIIIPKGSRKKFEKLLPDYYKDKLVEK